MNDLKDMLRKRSWPMNLLLAFCAFMTFIYMPFDFFLKPIEKDQEVWFGIMLTGMAAKATEPLHWLIYGAGYYGFLHMKKWLWPWASLYVLQIAVGMLIWNLLDERGDLIKGLIAASIFGALAAWLWLAKSQFVDLTETQTEDGISTHQKEE